MRYQRTRMCAAAALAFVLASGVALAQDPVKPGVITGAGAGSGAGDPSTTVDPTNGGVAGTGMGTTHKADAMAPKMSGTGASVPGKPGQGIKKQDR